MNLFEKFLYFLQGEMNEPKPFGWFHILCLCVTAIILFILYKLKKHHGEKQLKIVICTYGIIALVLEVLKQLIWSFNYDVSTGIIVWDYEWYSFPFQLCTTPIFVCIICLFLKKGKVRNSLFSYLSFVTILGSISTMLMPDSCLVEDILVNIHTMWLHLGSFVVSIYLLMSGEVKINCHSFRSSIIIFLVLVFIANFMNIFIYNIGVLKDETFNMFYISPYFISTLPVFDVIQSSVPYIVYLIIYILALTFGAFIIYSISKLVKRMWLRKSL